MREAIGQLMTNENMLLNAIPTVAVPFSERSFNLAKKWSKLERIRQAGIKFLLVKEDGSVIDI